MCVCVCVCVCIERERHKHTYYMALCVYVCVPQIFWPKKKNPQTCRDRGIKMFLDLIRKTAKYNLQMYLERVQLPFHMCCISHVPGTCTVTLHKGHCFMIASCAPYILSLSILQITARQFRKTFFSHSYLGVSYALEYVIK